MRDPFEDPTELGPEPTEGEDEPSYPQDCDENDDPPCPMCFPVDSADGPR